MQDDNGRKWLEKFMSLVSKDPPDYLCLHYYSRNADDAIKYLENMHNKWPKLKVVSSIFHPSRSLFTDD